MNDGEFTVRGGFDPRLPLISIRAREDWQRALILSSIFEPEKDIINKPSADFHNERNRFQILLTASAYAHEYRHYLQFLTAPTSCFLFRQRLRQAACHLRTPYRIKGWKKSYDTFPIPLLRWMETSKEKRLNLIEEISSQVARNLNCSEDHINVSWSDYGELADVFHDGFLIFKSMYKNDGVDAFVYPEEATLYIASKWMEYTTYTNAWGRSYSIKDAAAGDVPCRDPVAVFELSAILAQSRFIKQYFGSDNAIFFLESISKLPLGSTYRHCLGLIADIFKNSIESIVKHLEVLDAMVYWTFLGAFETSMGVPFNLMRMEMMSGRGREFQSFLRFGGVAPSVRFSLMKRHAHVILGGGLKSVRDIFQNLDELTGTVETEFYDDDPPLAPQLNEARRWNRSLTGTLNASHYFLTDMPKALQILDEMNGGPVTQLDDQIIKTAYFVGNSSRVAISHLLRDPNTFLESNRLPGCDTVVRLSIGDVEGRPVTFDKGELSELTGRLSNCNLSLEMTEEKRWFNKAKVSALYFYSCCTGYNYFPIHDAAIVSSLLEQVDEIVGGIVQKSPLGNLGERRSSFLSALRRHIPVNFVRMWFDLDVDSEVDIREASDLPDDLLYLDPKVHKLVFLDAEKNELDLEAMVELLNHPEQRRFKTDKLKRPPD